MLDVYLRGDVERISPEAPGAGRSRPGPPLRARRRRKRRAERSRASARSAISSPRSAMTPAAGNSRSMLEAIGAGLGLSGDRRPADDDQDPHRRALAAGGARRRRRGRRPGWRTTSSGCSPRSTPAIAQADALSRGLQQGRARPAGHRGARWTRRTRDGIPIVVDPKYRNFFRYRGATIFKPNRRELAEALGAEFELDHPEALPATFGRLGVDHLLLTLGERGMVLVSAGGADQARPDRGARGLRRGRRRRHGHGVSGARRWPLAARRPKRRSSRTMPPESRLESPARRRSRATKCSKRTTCLSGADQTPTRYPSAG